MYTNLLAQLDKLRKHNRQGSIKTKWRYYEAMKRFIRFLANEFRLEKLSNVAPKHLYAYVAKMKEAGKARATIETDLSAIRFWHDKVSDPRHKKLPDNAALDVGRRSHGEEDRTWSDDEFAKMVSIAADKGRDDYMTAFHLAYYAGLRIEECFTIDTSMVEAALRTDEITFHGKNGRWRTVPIDENIAKLLRDRKDKVKRGNKLLTPDDVPVDKAISSLQRFIERYRDEIQDPNNDIPLTFHGLRHSYACRQYLECRDLRKVSQLLGHERPEIAKRYLMSVLGGAEE